MAETFGSDRVKKAGKGLSIVETWQCELDGEIADEQFAPPAKK